MRGPAIERRSAEGQPGRIAALVQEDQLIE
jgi:hypothetical protein